MLRRSSRILLEVVGALAAIAVVVAGVLAWRLSQGPVSLDFVTPRLQASLSSLRDGVSVEVEGTMLAWEGWPETFALRATGVRVRSRNEAVARIPALDLRLSLSALVSGTLAPTSITARGARVIVVRSAEGFSFGGDSTQDDDDVSEVLPEVLRELVAAPSPDSRLSYLEELRIADASVTLHDDVLGAVWNAPTADVELRRRPGGVEGSAMLRLAFGDELVKTEAALDYAAEAQRIDLVASVAGLKPSALAGEVQSLAAAEGVTVPLSGTVSATFGLDGRIGTLVANLRGESGSFAWPELLPEPRPVHAFRANARLDRAAGELVLDSLAIDFGSEDEPGPRIDASGRVGGLGGDWDVSAEMQVADLTLDDLARYWPKGVGGNARPWVVENIRSGRAESATLSTELTVPGGEFDAVQLDALDGEIRYSGLDVHYLRPMPPVTGVHGTATFNPRSFHLDVAGGELGELQVSGARIDITGLDTTDHRIAIDFDVAGPLQSALTVLDHPRVDLVDPLGLEPATTSGAARVNARFAFPLIAELTMEEIDVEASARLSDVAVQDFVLGQDASQGDFDLTVDKAGMRLQGPVRLAGVPLDLTWHEMFGDAAPYRSEIQARIPELSAADRRQLGLDTVPFLDGPVSAALVARTDGQGGGSVKAAFNLRDAALSLPFFSWRKPPGEPGEASVTLALVDETPSALESFTLAAGGEAAPRLESDGSAVFADDGEAVREVTLNNFMLGRTKLRGLTAERQGDGWALQLRGGTFDVEPFLEQTEEERAAARAEQAGEDIAAEDAAPGPPIEIRTSELDRLRFAEGRFLTDVVLSAERGPAGWWRRLRMEASVPARFAPAPRPDGSVPTAPAGTGPSSFLFDYRPREDGRREVTVRAGDSGAMLRAVDLVDTIEGGDLRIDGLSRSADPTSPIEAEVEVRDFKVVNAPTLARVLTVASLTGISDLMRGDGIRFQRLTGDVTLADDVLSTELLHAYGPALGITAKGEVDLDANTTDLTGTIVPAASTNRVLGKIPVLGKLLTGGEGEGVFAVTYSLSGPVEDPKIDVNPLSALAPGFLRGLFGLLGNDQGTPENWPRAVPGDVGR